MVTQRALKWCMDNYEQIAKDAKTEPAVTKRVLKVIESDMEKRRRHPKAPAPEGGICLREASRKYRLNLSTLSRWVAKDLIKELSRTKNELYVSENDIIRLIATYKYGRGTRQ